MQKMYWYRDGQLTHVVFATTKGIAQWYVDAVYDRRNWVFMREDTRSARGNESHTVLAHSADKVLRDCYKEWCANGGNGEYRNKLACLVSKLPPLPYYLVQDED